MGKASRSFIILIILLGLGEFFMRIYYPQTWLESLFARNCSYQINKLGFREKEITNDFFQPGVTRILFLGDSFTYGSNICHEEDRFSNLIESRLNSIGAASGYKYRIYNAGISGSTPEVWYGALDVLIRDFKPHFVFAIFFLRDGTSLPTSLKLNVSIIDKISKKYTDKFWYKNSSIGKYIGDFLIKKEFSKQFIKKMQNSYLGNDVEKSVWFKEQRYLLKIRDECKKNMIDFHLILFPMLFGLESQYEFYAVEREIIRFSGSSDIPAFTLLPGFIGENSRTLWVAENDQHPNEKGNRIAAKTLYPYLADVISTSR